MRLPDWPKRGLTTETLEELYRRGRQYVATRMPVELREDAVQDGMCEVLKEVTQPHDNYPDDPAGRLDYLTKTLYNEALKRVTRKSPPDTNIPTD